MYSCTVLIESDWNLKEDTILFSSASPSINRIRLEFKEKPVDYSKLVKRGINRIRLEFKEYARISATPARISY